MGIVVWPVFLGIGAAAGFATSALGVGASTLIVPALMVALPASGVSTADLPGVALATSMTASIATSLAAVRAHVKRGNLERPFSAPHLALMIAAAAGALLGSLALPALPPQLALVLLAAFQASMALRLWVGRSHGHRPGAEWPSHGPESSPLDRWSTKAYLGFVGCLASMGLAGSLIVPYLVTMRIPQRVAVALASWVGIGIGAVASISYASQMPRHSGQLNGLHGLVYAPAAVWLIVGAVAAAPLGASVARRLKPLVLQRAIAASLLCASIYTLTARLQ